MVPQWWSVEYNVELRRWGGFALFQIYRIQGAFACSGTYETVGVLSDDGGSMSLDLHKQPRDKIAPGSLDEGGEVRSVDGDADHNVVRGGRAIVVDLNAGEAISHCSNNAGSGTVAICTAIAPQNDEAVSELQLVSPAKKRNWGAVGPHYKEKTLGRIGALEEAMMKFADRKHNYIISPDVGTEFDHVEEAFEYYNMYSWERGFGIKWGKERISSTKESRKLPLEKRYKLGREINCSCSGDRLLT